MTLSNEPIAENPAATLRLTIHNQWRRAGELERCVKFAITIVSLVLVSVGCSQHSNAVTSGSVSAPTTFLTNFGTLKESHGSSWSVEVSATDRTAKISRRFKIPTGGAGVTSIEAPNWHAQSNWFAGVDNDNRVWVYDGVTNLCVCEITSSGGTRISDLTTWGQAVPPDVYSRLSPATQQFLKQ